MIAHLFFKRFGPTPVLLLWMLLGITSGASAQVIRYVTMTGTTAPANATTSWATSTSNLQGAIDASNANDQVWVKAGIYKPTTGTNQEISFTMRQGVKIYGGFTGTETTLTGPTGRTLTTPSSTTLSGEIGNPASTTDNSYHVIYNLNLSNTALLDGFMITGGYAAVGFGGGMYNDNSSPTIDNCLFQSNYAYSRGGGMYNNGGSPRLTNCQFKGNFTATYNTNAVINHTVDNSGGGMYNNGSNPILTDCLFQGNYGINNYGGGMYSTSGSSYTLINCTFQQNSAYGGGGVFNDNSSPTITGCTFESNTVVRPVSGNDATRGGGMTNSTNSNPRITNCTFLNNVGAANQSSSGGGLYNANSNPILIGCTFRGNTADGSGAVFNFSSSASFSACLFQSNTAASGGAIGNTTSNAPLTSCTFVSNSATTLGGGAINMSGSSPLVTNCLFLTNSATTGGGAIDLSNSSNPIITNTLFQQNTATAQGGAIQTGSNSSPDLVSCTFVSNSAPSGGALYNTTSTPSFTACSFQSNSASASGGAITNFSNVTLIGTTSDFRNNTAPKGGAMFNYFSRMELVNSSFQSNSATSSGGALANESSTVPITNCSFQSNSATLGGVLSSTNSTVSINNCVLFGNGGANTLNGFTHSARYSLFDQSVTGYTSTTGNITTTVTPFASTTSTVLSSTAPAINTADPATTSATVGTTDLAGNNRFFGRLDMGAYEDQTPVILIITNPVVTTANTNAVFSQTFTASGGTGPYSFSLASGSLPTGLTLTPGGVLSGTPTQTGSFTVTVSASDPVSNTGVSTPYALTVGATSNFSLSLTVSPNPVLPDQPVTYTVQVANTGPSTSYSTVVQVLVPAGLNSLTINAPGSWSSSFDAGTGALSFTNTTGLTAGSTATISFGLTPSASAVGTTPVMTAFVTTTATDPDLTNNSASVSTTITSADLSDLTLSTGTLTPGFAGSITSYSLSGCNSVTSLTVTPTLADANATIQARINGGSYSAVASGVPTGPLVLQAGTNVVEVRVTAQGGVATRTYSLTVLQQPTVSLVPLSGTLTCASPMVTLTATSGLTNYSFSTGQNGPGNTLPVSSAGTYSVVATAANGCTNVASATVVSSTAVISASLVASGAISCTSTSVTLTATPSNLTYSFGSGAIQIGSTNQATVSAAGTYSVVVSDAGGCSAVAQVTVTGSTTAPTSPTLTASNAGSLTCGQSALTLTASATGSGLSYSFRGAGVVTQNGSSATVNAANTYSVVITGNNSCTALATTPVVSNTVAPTLSLTPLSGTLTCASPTVTLTATSGLTNYSFSTGQNGPGNTLPVSSAGTYSVVATAANGCTNVASATVVSSTVVISASLVASGAISCTSTSVTLTAFPSNLTYSFGSGVVQIGSTSQATVSAAGTYSVIVSDAGGCSAVAQVTVVDNSTFTSVSISPSNSTLDCVSSLVSLSAIGSGALVWSTQESTSVISVTAAGIYSVTLTNSSGCKTVSSATVAAGILQQQAVVSVNGPISCNNAVVTIQGGGASSYTLLGPLSYRETNNTGIFTVSAGGSYTGIASQSSGCSASGVVTVIDDSVVPSATNFRASGVLGPGNCTVQLLATGTGNAFVMTGPGNYVFSNVYRCPGSYSIYGLDVRQPGTYTLRVYSGGRTPVTYTTVVTGTACSTGQ